MAKIRALFSGPNVYQLERILKGQKLGFARATEVWFDVDGESGKVLARSTSNIFVRDDLRLALGEPGERRHTIEGEGDAVRHFLERVLCISMRGWDAASADATALLERRGLDE